MRRNLEAAEGAQAPQGAEPGRSQQAWERWMGQDPGCEGQMSVGLRKEWRGKFKGSGST